MRKLVTQMSRDASQAFDYLALPRSSWRARRPDGASSGERESACSRDIAATQLCGHSS